MGTMKLAVQPVVPVQAETEHSRAVPSASALQKTEPVGESFRFSVFLAGLILIISLALVAEVAVGAAVDAAFSLVARVYHQVTLSDYDAKEIVATSEEDEIAKPSAPSVNSSTANRHSSPSTHQQIATDKIRPDCLGSPHACN
jgi:hypothetical protein